MLDRLDAVRAAVPLTPEPETSCCARLVERADVPARDDARTWLTFLRGLGLAEETDLGYVRTRADPDREALPERFLEGVYGARELRETVARAGPFGADEAFERFREHVPQYERHPTDDWERVWRGRVTRLLGWGTLVGVFERTDAGYAASQGGAVRSDSESST
ncbi:hypothetical protein BRD10_00990 [Halobacteriales archaeon SW_12_71_31]|nr:MAG: hypothetical protein BRD10_00990 [Halobacteriales archaeon SW_12_71_31]